MEYFIEKTIGKELVEKRESNFEKLFFIWQIKIDNEERITSTEQMINSQKQRLRLHRFNNKNTNKNLSASLKRLPQVTDPKHLTFKTMSFSR